MTYTVPVPHGLPVQCDAGPFDPPRQITRLREGRPPSPLVYEEHIVDIAERLLDVLARLTPPVDLAEEFALPVPSLVICELLGFPRADRKTFQVTAKSLEEDVALDEKMATLGCIDHVSGRTGYAQTRRPRRGHSIGPRPS